MRRGSLRTATLDTRRKANILALLRVSPAVRWLALTRARPRFVADVARLSPVSGFRINRARCIARPAAEAQTSGGGALPECGATARVPKRHSPACGSTHDLRPAGRHGQRGETPRESLRALSHRGTRDTDGLRRGTAACRAKKELHLGTAAARGRAFGCTDVGPIQEREPQPWTPSVYVPARPPGPGPVSTVD